MMHWWDVIEKAYDSVDIYSGEHAFLAHFRPLPDYVRHLLAAHWCRSEVDNGGFDQFFLNSTGVLAPEAVSGFRAIGLMDAADVVAVAISRFGGNYPRDQDVRNEAMKSLPNDGSTAFGGRGLCFGDLNERFYNYCDYRDFDRIADEYVRSQSTSLDAEHR